MLTPFTFWYAVLVLVFIVVPIVAMLATKIITTVAITLIKRLITITALLSCYFYFFCFCIVWHVLFLFIAV